jgi:hypothetical protein
MITETGQHGFHLIKGEIYRPTSQPVEQFSVLSHVSIFAQQENQCNYFQSQFWLDLARILHTQRAQVNSRDEKRRILIDKVVQVSHVYPGFLSFIRRLRRLTQINADFHRVAHE